MENLIEDLQIVDESSTHCLIGSPSKRYVRTSKEAGEICRRLIAGEPPEQIQSDLQRKNSSIDINAFINQLRELELWGPYESMELKGGIQSISWVIVFSRIIFSPIMMGVYGGILIYGVSMVLRYFSITEVEAGLLQPSDIGNVLVILLLAQYIFAFLHEGGHALAAWGYKIPVRIKFGFRWIFPVLLTRMNGLYGLPRNKRWIPILAGIAINSVVLAVAVSLLTWGPDSYSTIFLWVVIHQMFIMIWECLIFLRTDLYYLIVMTTGVYNLHQRAVNWLKGLLRLKWTMDSQYSRSIIIYGIVYVLGAVGVLFVFCKGLVDYVWPTMSLSINNIIASPWVTKSLGSWLFIAIFSIWIVAISMSLFRSNHKKI